MSTKAIRKPKVRMWERIMLLHAPWISKYALRKLEKWYFEEEPRLYTADLHIEPTGSMIKGVANNSDDAFANINKKS